MINHGQSTIWLQGRLNTAILKRFSEKQQAVEYLHKWTTIKTSKGLEIPKMTTSSPRSPSRLGLTTDHPKTMDWGEEQAHMVSGWRTPDAPTTGGPRTHTTSQGQGHQVCLEEQACMAGNMDGWRTPNAQMIEPKGNVTKFHGRTPLDPQVGLADQARLAGWPTAQASDANQRQGPGTASNQRNIERGQLANVATLSGWGTPRVTTNGGIPCPESTGKGSRLEDQAAMADSGHQSSIPASTGRSGESQPPLRLNPYFSGWLMGFPVAWTNCGQRVASLFVRKSKGGSSS